MQNSCVICIIIIFLLIPDFQPSNGKRKNSELQKKKGSCRGKEEAANPISGSWEVEDASSAINIHSPDQICFYQIAGMGTNKLEEFWNCCLYSTSPCQP